ncbi:MAG: pyruvate-formate lyase-activating enzyme [Candidatus Paceibacteria bacterium]|jgi:pyruvate-formate lyase-activating enzyme
MTKIRALVIVDCSQGYPNSELRSLWQRSGFERRVEALGEHVYIWANEPGESPWDRLASTADLERALLADTAETLILVDPTQVFLDVELALSGLACFDPAYHDSFTQWEHCRLPVGIGIRALAARTWIQLSASSPEEALSGLRNDPAGRRFAYDVEHRVTYEESLLDSRAVASLRGLLPDSETWPQEREWSLAGFLEMASTVDAEALRYQPETVAARVDERRMPAAYGFESDACASFPTYVMFDITNVCNARCIHCPQSLRDEAGELPSFLIKKEHQSLEVYKQVIDECTQHDVRFVRITADGEPLVHPHLFEMLEYARDQNVGPVGLTTNGSLLTPERAQRLLESGVAVVDFSLDALHRETFDKVRVGLNFEKTRANVLHFIDLVNASGADVKVMVSFVKQDSNVDEVDEFREYWSPRVAEVVVREMISNVGLNDPSTSSWPGWDARWPCAHFFRRVVVNHQGLLKACPIDWEQRTVNEHVKQATLFDQWHGDFYWRHRMQHLNDAIVETSACKKCPDWAGTPWDMGYEKIITRLTGSTETSV